MAGQPVPANPAGSPGAGRQQTLRTPLTLCRKLRRSRSGGAAAMVQGAAPYSWPRFRQASVLQSSRCSGSPSQSVAGRGHRGPKTSELSQSKVPVREGQGPVPITEEQARDSDQPEDSMGGGAGCSIIRRRKRRDPAWRRPRGPGGSAHVRQRSLMGARAEPSPSLPGAPGGLRG